MDAERVVVRLPTPTLKAIPALLADREDRSDFMREAADLEIAIRSIDVYPELLGYLTANETLTEFCARAVRQAAQRRINMLKDPEGDDGPKQAQEAPNPAPGRGRRNSPPR